ncbi:MAG TPA: MOSC domain-containing protein [Longimicrobiales bacterium]|nr:MOSC domain-containing protein [Longimicrobiales bacterium]
MSGRLEAIWVKRARKGVMDPAGSARLLPDHGVADNPRHGSRRQVTIIEKEAWDAMMEELDADVDPSARRANLMVSGVRLHDTRGRLLIVGRCAIRIGGETRPCERMDEALPGLRETMRPDWRGGVFGRVEVGGEVAVGDPVELRDAE